MPPLLALLRNLSSSVAALGIVFRLPSRTAVIHYVDCAWYRRAVRRHIPLTSKARVRMCTWCKPSDEDVLAGPPEVSWYAYGPAALPGVKVRQVDTAGNWEMVEDIAARHSLGWGKTPRRKAS